MSEKKHAELEPLRQLQIINRQDMEAYQDNLVNTPATDFADYKYRVGIIHGLAMAERNLLDLDTEIVND